MSLKTTSSDAYLLQSRGSVHSKSAFFARTPCVALLSLDLNPVQKARVQERVVQEHHVYAELHTLSNISHFVHKHQSTFYEITNQLLGKYYRFEGKSGENTK